MKRLILLMMLAVPAYGQKTLNDGVQDLALQIAERVKATKQQRVAVLPFQDLHHAQSDLGAYIAEELSTSLGVCAAENAEKAGKMMHANQLPNVPAGAEVLAPAVTERLAAREASGVLHLGSGE